MINLAGPFALHGELGFGGVLGLSARPAEGRRLFSQTAKERLCQPPEGAASTSALEPLQVGNQSPEVCVALIAQNPGLDTLAGIMRPDVLLDREGGRSRLGDVLTRSPSLAARTRAARMQARMAIVRDGTGYPRRPGLSVHPRPGMEQASRNDERYPFGKLWLIDCDAKLPGCWTAERRKLRRCGGA